MTVVRETFYKQIRQNKLRSALLVLVIGPSWRARLLRGLLLHR